jgi:hypothetical protein
MSVVNIKGRSNRDIKPDEVYIGRQINMGGWHLCKSKWCNPYSVKDYGRDEALRKYEQFG